MLVTLCPSVRFSSTDTVNRAGNRHDRASIFCLVTRHDSYRSSLPLINKYAIGIAIRRACVDCAGTTHPKNVSRCCRFARDAALYGRWTSYFKVYTVYPFVPFCSIAFPLQRTNAWKTKDARKPFDRSFVHTSVSFFRILPERSYHERTFRVVGRPWIA